MEIEFDNTKLEKSISPKNIVTTYGYERSKTIKKRFAELKAAQNLAEMFHFSGNFHPLSGNQLGKFALHISPNFRILLRPNHQPPILKPDGGLELAQIHRVLILDIGVDYH